MHLVIEISRFFNQNFQIVWYVALFLGLWTVLSEIHRLVHFVFVKMKRQRKNLQQRYGKGTWALVTGSSQGIGKAFAFSLAKQNFNIILTARTESKLIQTQKQIRSEFPQIEVKYIVVDFIKTCQKQIIQQTWYKQNKLSQLDISIVVNNVGIDCLDKLNDLSLGQIIRLIELDCLFVCSMQYLFMERWVKEKGNTQDQGRRKLMINVASLCAQMPISYLSVYSAAKIYVDRLTQACALEYPQIDFMSLRPSEVCTRMTAFKKDILTIQPYQCVQPLLDDVGYQSVSHGHTLHAVQAWVYATAPFWFFNLIWERIFLHQFKETRQKFQKKK